jgi:mRNA interferase HigB
MRVFPKSGNTRLRIIARSTLDAFSQKHPAAKPALDHWLRVTRAADWAEPQDVLTSFSKAKVLNAERVRFEIQGGNFRLIVAFDFPRRIAFVKFLGTHADYDRIDALTVSLF